MSHQLCLFKGWVGDPSVVFVSRVSGWAISCVCVHPSVRCACVQVGDHPSCFCPVWLGGPSVGPQWVGEASVVFVCVFPSFSCVCDHLSVVFVSRVCGWAFSCICTHPLVSRVCV